MVRSRRICPQKDHAPEISGHFPNVRKYCQNMDPPLFEKMDSNSPCQANGTRRTTTETMLGVALPNLKDVTPQPDSDVSCLGKTDGMHACMNECLRFQLAMS